MQNRHSFPGRDITQNMFDTLHDDLRKRGWQAGTYRGFLRQVRGGFEWEVGHGRSGRLELRWKYKSTGGLEQTGEQALSEYADRVELEDVMTGIYLRVHEKPDPTRVFGGGKRQGPRPIAPTVNTTTAPISPEETGQGTMDL